MKLDTLAKILAHKFVGGNVLYRYLFIPNINGYVVYRHFFETNCTFEEMAATHGVATFVCESEACDYCAYRNEMTAKHGSDDVTLIEHQHSDFDAIGQIDQFILDESQSVADRAAAFRFMCREGISLSTEEAGLDRPDEELVEEARQVARDNDLSE